MQGAVPVLMFHAVGAHNDTLTVTQARLRGWLEALRGAGYAVVGLTEALASTQPRAVGLTFDDAYTDFVSAAMPILDELGCSATLYVPVAHVAGVADWQAGSLAGRPVLDWQGLREVRDAGHEIGSHGYRHIPLDVLPDATVRAEASRARQILQDQLDLPVVSFCYPHGYASAKTASAVRDVGHTNGCVIGYRPHRVDDDPMRVTRLLMPPDARPAEAVDVVTDARVQLVTRAKAVAGPGWRATRRIARRAGWEWT